MTGRTRSKVPRRFRCGSLQSSLGPDVARSNTARRLLRAMCLPLCRHTEASHHSRINTSQAREDLSPSRRPGRVRPGFAFALLDSVAVTIAEAEIKLRPEQARRGRTVVPGNGGALRGDGCGPFASLLIRGAAGRAWLAALGSRGIPAWRHCDGTRSSTGDVQNDRMRRLTDGTTTAEQRPGLTTSATRNAGGTDTTWARSRHRPRAGTCGAARCGRRGSAVPAAPQ